VLNAGLIAPAIAVLHAALLKEKAECPVPSKPFRPAPLANRSVGARRVARLAKVGREEPIVGLLIHGVSVAGIAARERARPETRKRHRNRLKRLNPRGNGMAAGAPDPHYLVQGRGPRPSPRRIPVASRRSPDGGNERHARCAYLCGAAAGRPETRKWRRNGLK